MLDSHSPSVSSVDVLPSPSLEQTSSGAKQKITSEDVVDDIKAYYVEGDVVRPPCNWHVRHPCKKCGARIVTSTSSERIVMAIISDVTERPVTCRRCRSDAGNYFKKLPL